MLSLVCVIKLEISQNFPGTIFDLRRTLSNREKQRRANNLKFEIFSGAGLNKIKTNEEVFPL